MNYKKVKKVLFVGVTDCYPGRNPHLRKKYEGLSGGMRPYILGRGGFLRRKVWNAEFYLLPSTFFWPLAFWLAIWLCLTKKIDVIVAQSPLVEGFLGAVLKTIFKKELIIEIHGDWKEGPFLSKKRRLAFIARRFTPFLAKISFLAADKIRGVANNLIIQAKKIAPNKRYFLFPTFTDLDVFLAERDTKFDNFVLFVGRAQKVKGVEYLIKAFARVKEHFPDFRLVLVGEGLPEGKLSLEETKNKMKNCYCLVLPSLSEGLPRVLMEAMALGKPVIGSNVGGIPELIKDGETGLLFEAGNSEELADKLIILLRDKKMAVEMGQKGREFVEKKLSNEKYIENYISMIKA